jgi:hypothetical protein
MKNPRIEGTQGVPVRELCIKVAPINIRVSELITEGTYLASNISRIFEDENKRLQCKKLVLWTAARLLQVLSGVLPITACDDYLTPSVVKQVRQRVKDGIIDFDHYSLTNIFPQTSATGILKSTILFKDLASNQILVMVLFVKPAFSKLIVSHFELSIDKNGIN